MAKQSRTTITNPTAGKLAGLTRPPAHRFATTPATPDAIRPKVVPRSRQVTESQNVRITNQRANQIERDA